MKDSKKAPARRRFAQTEPGGESPGGGRARPPAGPRPIEEILELRPAKSTAGREADPEAVAVAYPPGRLQGFLSGQLTLGELQGVSKEEQYQMAEFGYQCLRLGRYEDARTIFDGLLAFDPFDAYFHTARATIDHQRGDFEAAEQRYSRALEINPFSATARGSRAELRFLRRDAVGGLDDALRTIEDDPRAEAPATLRARALVLMLARAFETPGPEALRRAATEDPDRAATIAEELLLARPTLDAGATPATERSTSPVHSKSTASTRAAGAEALDPEGTTSPAPSKTTASGRASDDPRPSEPRRQPPHRSAAAKADETPPSKRPSSRPPGPVRGRR